MALRQAQWLVLMGLWRRVFEITVAECQTGSNAFLCGLMLFIYVDVLSSQDKFYISNFQLSFTCVLTSTYLSLLTVCLNSSFVQQQPTKKKSLVFYFFVFFCFFTSFSIPLGSVE